MATPMIWAVAYGVLSYSFKREEEGGCEKEMDEKNDNKVDEEYVC